MSETEVQKAVKYLADCYGDIIYAVRLADSEGNVFDSETWTEAMRRVALHARPAIRWDISPAGEISPATPRTDLPYIPPGAVVWLAGRTPLHRAGVFFNWLRNSTAAALAAKDAGIIAVVISPTGTHDEHRIGIALRYIREAGGDTLQAFQDANAAGDYMSGDIWQAAEKRFSRLPMAREHLEACKGNVVHAQWRAEDAGQEIDVEVWEAAEAEYWRHKSKREGENG